MKPPVLRNHRKYFIPGQWQPLGTRAAFPSPMQGKSTLPSPRPLSSLGTCLSRDQRLPLDLHDPVSSQQGSPRVGGPNTGTLRHHHQGTGISQAISWLGITWPRSCCTSGLNKVRGLPRGLDKAKIQANLDHGFGFLHSCICLGPQKVILPIPLSLGRTVLNQPIDQTDENLPCF